MKKNLFILAILIITICSLCGCTNNALIEESRANINPYIEYVNDSVAEGESLIIANDLYENIESVEFMGIEGEVSYGFDDKYAIPRVKYCSWSSNESFTEEEFQSFAKELEKYFGCEAEKEYMEYSDGSTYRYYWIDQDNDYKVSYGHDLFMYDPDSNIEIMWSYEYCEGINFYGVDW